MAAADTCAKAPVFDYSGAIMELTAKGPYDAAVHTQRENPVLCVHTLSTHGESCVVGNALGDVLLRVRSRRVTEAAVLLNGETLLRLTRSEMDALGIASVRLSHMLSATNTGVGIHSTSAREKLIKLGPDLDTVLSQFALGRNTLQLHVAGDGVTAADVTCAVRHWAFDLASFKWFERYTVHTQHDLRLSVPLALALPAHGNTTFDRGGERVDRYFIPESLCSAVLSALALTGPGLLDVTRAHVYADGVLRGTVSVGSTELTPTPFPHSHTVPVWHMPFGTGRGDSGFNIGRVDALSVEVCRPVAAAGMPRAPLYLVLYGLTAWNTTAEQIMRGPLGFIPPERQHVRPCMRVPGMDLSNDGRALAVAANLDTLIRQQDWTQLRALVTVTPWLTAHPCTRVDNPCVVYGDKTAVQPSQHFQEGYWSADGGVDHLPIPVPADTPVCAAFLDQLEAVECMANRIGSLGHSYCRLCRRRNGSDVLTLRRGDTAFVWPSGLMHYYKAHNVHPSDDFCQFVMAADANNADGGDAGDAGSAAAPAATLHDVVNDGDAGNTGGAAAPADALDNVSDM